MSTSTLTNKKRGLTLAQKRIIKSWVFTVIAILIGLILAMPFLWMIFCSFQATSSDVYAYPPKFPNFFNYSNFSYYLKETNFLTQLGNTLLLVFSNMIIGTSASVLVAYGFARFNAIGKKVCFTILLATMMLPWVVTMVPAYMLFAKLEMIGGEFPFLPLILPSIGGSAYNIFLLRQFFMGLPKELDEAAKIDGCNSFQILTRILLPNCTPILATIVIFSFIGTWSDYVGPSIYLREESAYTLALGLQFLKTSNYMAPPWHHLLAGAVIYALPMVIVYLTCQKAFVRGAVGSAIK